MHFDLIYVGRRFFLQPMTLFASNYIECIERRKQAFVVAIKIIKYFTKHFEMFLEQNAMTYFKPEESCIQPEVGCIDYEKKREYIVSLLIEMYNLIQSSLIHTHKSTISFYIQFTT